MQVLTNFKYLRMLSIKHITKCITIVAQLKIDILR